ncbi:YHYH domain-containing protein [Shewanella sp. 10N.286.48.B5]|uniref:YHYH domain-containing protein n=1 Tax=Shewanella sp. 10N.286.48.B5 TaxID=1880834 RepID=UPI000C860A0C|nr:YHYH domain-containing protein [Shewanella sp. 10N.286.48.B5]PMH86731.1 hypothetical protein BCU57_09780 [Shewanella sp. 10N.286.48.B5]
MNKILLVVVLLALTSTQAFSHSGRTDSNGGHNCSQKSINKGLCTGYHYHNGFTNVDSKGEEAHSHNGVTHTHEKKEIESEKQTAKSAE